MDVRTLGSVAGIAGGACWLTRWILDLAGVSSEPREAVYLVGAVLLALAFVAFGMALVKSSALWLRLIVGVAFPVLVWSVLEVLHRAEPEPVDGVFGLAVAAISVLLLSRRPRPEKSRRAGAHAR